MSLEQGPTPREILAQGIQAAQPDWTVKAFPWKPRQVAKDQAAVAVWRTDLDLVNGLELRHELAVNVYVSRTEGAEAEAEADDALDGLLLALQGIPGIRWSKAQRMVFDNVFTGWQLTCHAISTNVYRQAVLAGGA